MSSRRLFAWQVERLKKSGNGAAIIAAACRWYELGRFEDVTPTQCKNKKGDFVLQIYSIKNNLPYDSRQLRNILALYFASPKDDLKTQIDLLNNQIKAMFENLPPWRLVR